MSTPRPADAARRHAVLFLCVQNSARSQMAEALARRIAPPGVEVFSAGSSPARVRPEALAVLAEVGIDASEHYAKAIDQVPAERIRLVVTLCAEEVCPALAGPVERRHWPLPDPARVEGTEEQRLGTYRRVRDELARRIAALFAEPGFSTPGF